MQSSARMKHTLMLDSSIFVWCFLLYSFCEEKKIESFYDAYVIVCNNADLHLCYNRLVNVLCCGRKSKFQTHTDCALLLEPNQTKLIFDCTFAEQKVKSKNKWHRPNAHLMIVSLFSKWFRVQCPFFVSSSFTLFNGFHIYIS